MACVVGQRLTRFEAKAFVVPMSLQKNLGECDFIDEIFQTFRSVSLPYLRLVAMPPLMCLSLLFFSSTALTRK